MKNLIKITLFISIASFFGACSTTNIGQGKNELNSFKSLNHIHRNEKY